MAAVIAAKLRVPRVEMPLKKHYGDGISNAMKFAVIDTNEAPMQAAQGRGLGFVQALEKWTLDRDYRFIRYGDVAAQRDELIACRGLILSGSAFDLALPVTDGFDQETYQKMIPLLELMLAFHGPVLGICFGHQLMALADEFDPGRAAFAGLRVRNMPNPPEKHLVQLLQMAAPLRFLERRELWAQYHHKQEVVKNETLLKYYEIIAGTENCAVQLMQHRKREWFGAQFHPEVGKKSKAGETGRHEDAVRDGRMFLQEFVRYCLR